ncbi:MULTISPECIES: hypothetical protein [Bacillaceae]|uniref:Uncharacterized protein n=1 Tax=Oceanobacillus bengalensis TaxID=1435466 RepID=A0A494YXW0_9BACI|nr:hypothetical protein [Oceanobacillus bengalensis]RKQ15067.1 hypothetical protein D8M05_11460 [Oceanobacillus bengalensis]
MDIEYIFEHGSFEEFQQITTLRENQLYWLNYIVSSIEKRRVAEILFGIGYSIKEVEDILVLPDGEASLMKVHLDKFGTIDTENILKALTKIYQRQTLEAVIERLLDKNYNKDVVEDVIQLFNK